jgi:peptidoglycan/xylan/chitin deacetylase (PgdA/CDA1 family)
MTAKFAEHLKYFFDHFRIVPLDVALDGLSKTSEPLLALTFDDCFRETVETVANVLSVRSIPATFFLPTASVVATDSEWAVILKCRFHLRRKLERTPLAVLKALGGAGHSVESHGHSHVSLQRMSATDAKDDILRASDLIRDTLGYRPRHFAYPFGEDPRSNGLDSFLSTIDVKAAFTIRRGVNTPRADLLHLRRDHLEGDWPLSHVRHFMSTRHT